MLTLTISDNDFADFSEQQNAVRRRNIKLQPLRPSTTTKCFVTECYPSADIG